ncbi:MAG: hypothetical protein QM601_07495 [Pseudoxanthomonas sp.]
MNAWTRLHLRLRLLAAAGGVISWTLPLFVALIAYFLFLHFSSSGKDVTVATALFGGLGNAFWWTFGGARLLGLDSSARGLCLPGVNRSSLCLAALALLVSVGVPAALAAAAHANVAVMALACVLGAGGGLAYTTLPPWVMFAVLPLPLAAARLDDRLQAPLAKLGGPILLLAAIVAVITIGVWGWRRTLTRDWSKANPWIKPTLVALQSGSLDQVAMQQQADLQTGRTAWTQGIAPPIVPGDLREHPEQAMALALGPVFVPSRPLAALLSGAAMPALLLAFWWLLFQHDENNVHMLPPFALFLLGSAGAAPLSRIILLRKRPALGLHELALLPGLGRPREVVTQLRDRVQRCLLLRLAPYLLAAWIIGAWTGMPHDYYSLCVFVAAACMMLMSWLSLRSLYRVPGVALLVGVFLPLMVLMGYSLTQLADPAAANHHLSFAAWILVLLAATFLHVKAVYRLRHRPHPWLQN